jgi:predicted regulator of Ras-like GTPase activity (Roadblock/LC7/MglB family)
MARISRTSRTTRTHQEKAVTVSNYNETLEGLLSVQGAMCAALVDSTSGMVLGTAGSGLDLDTAAAGNTEVVRAKLKTIKALGLDDMIDDILITLTSQYHIIRPLRSTPEVFLYVVLDSAKANLALARLKVKEADLQLQL